MDTQSEEEIPLDDINDNEAPKPIQIFSKKIPEYYEEGSSFEPFDSDPSPPASPISSSVDAQS